MPWDREPAVADEAHAGYREELFQLRRRAAAQDDDVGQKEGKLLQQLERLRLGAGGGRILDHLGQGAVEVGNQQKLAWRHLRGRRPFPGACYLVEFLDHPSTLQTRTVPLDHQLEKI